MEQNAAQPDDHHVGRGVDETVRLGHRLAYCLALGLGHIDDGLQADGNFAKGVD